MKNLIAPVFFVLSSLLAACQPQAPICSPVTGAPKRLTTWPTEASPGPGADLAPVPAIVNINGKSVSFDRIVKGPLCKATWQGLVYVSCEVQVHPWVDQPLFLKDCDLSIAPDTVVYVAAHNNAAYYNGCSCHTGEER